MYALSGAAVPIAVTAAYIGSSWSYWLTPLALLILGCLSAAAWVVGNRKLALVAGACCISLAPILIGWNTLVPPLGAAVFLVLVHRILRSKGTYLLPKQLAVISVAVAIVVAVGFAQVIFFGQSARGMTLEWIVLPGQEYGKGIAVTVVVLASVVNAAFEEAMWRVALPSLFPAEVPRYVQWVIISLCFGAAHMYGTPGGLLGMSFSAVFGLSMCLLRQLSGGSIWWILGVHFCADVILIGAIYGIFV